MFLGGTIATWLQEFGKFDRSAVTMFTGQILDSLKYLHDHEVSHVDIQEENILLDFRGVCKLSEFGQALTQTELDGVFY